MSLGRRDPGHMPNLPGMTWAQAKVPLSDVLKRLWKGFSGLPGGFLALAAKQIKAGGAASAGTETTGWAASDHIHDIKTATSSGLSNSNTEGSGTSLLRADAGIKRDVRVQKALADVGTRNKLDFEDTATITLTATDDPGDDAVKITADIVPGTATPSWGRIVFMRQFPG